MASTAFALWLRPVWSARKKPARPWPRSRAASSARMERSSTEISRSAITAATTASSKTVSCSANCSQGLATIFVLDDGSVEMKTWAEADNKLLARIKYARQNGVPLIEFDGASSVAGPGTFGGALGTGELVRLGKLQIAHDAFRGRAAEEPWKALPDLCRVLRCHTFRDGSRFPGLPVRLRHAPGYECSGAHVLWRSIGDPDRSWWWITS